MAFQGYHLDAATAGVGGMLAISKILEVLTNAQGWLASLSYIATIGLAIVTVYLKLKNKGK